MHKINSGDIFINREISWLSFNERVLQEAADPETPLFERIRFLGIFSNNLDEFFRVRVATVKRMIDFGIDEDLSLGNLTPEDLHKEIKREVSLQQTKFQQIFSQIMTELRKENIFMINEKELAPAQEAMVRKYFQEKVLPNLVPIMLSKETPFPYLRDRSAYLAVKLSRQAKPNEFAYSLIRIPSRSVSRFLVLPDIGNRKYVIMLDDIIRFCFDDLFFYFDYDKYEAFTLKITRDAEIDIDDDISKSFVEKMEDGLKKRKIGKPVRLIYDREMPADMLEFILNKMKIKDQENVVSGGRYHNHKDFMEFPEIGKPKHYYSKLPPLIHRDLRPYSSILRVVRRKDIMLHYPYQKFSHFIDLLREAAIDPQVEEIGVTIYRVAPDSKVVNALLNAVRNGKKVTVAIELLARFDEEYNIFWSGKLQEEGANVINGIPGLKVHSKLAWIKRIEGKVHRNYAYIGTGNFHEGTARIYADDGLLTSDPRIADEVANVFEFLKHNYEHFKYEHLIVSPFQMRKTFMRLIRKEIKNARAGKEAWMILKMNSLIDQPMMEALYNASQAGVKIQLIVRGIFGMKTGIEGLSENIKAISIVDKYLEHSRVFVFADGGNPRYFIGSADWMPRNLNRRVEVAVPVYDPDIQAELYEMLMMQLRDNSKARILDPELSNHYQSSGNGIKYRAQEDYYNYLKNKHKIVMTIYHNPRCAKSRAALQYLEKREIQADIRNYIDGIPENELRDLLKKLEMKPFDLVCTQEPEFKANYKGKNLSDDEWISILSENPRLLKRPIVVNGDKAVLAQPPELIDEII